ncbi:MAG: hypothetical protein JXQ72_08325 [Anaerolineae bacterium]|nr:hypothetical protein [Anaerolineae bacterium]
MNIHYTLDDSAARLPLTIRSAEGVLDRAGELRSGPGIHLVEVTTQHMLNTGATLLDELNHYFDDNEPSELDPYALADCYANQNALEDLWGRLHDAGDSLVALHEVAALFPASYQRDLHFTLALTAVGFPAFGYVRAYQDSEGEEYHGMVVNLAQARPHVERQTGEFSLSLLTDMIRYGFFNHEAFLLAYADYCAGIGRGSDRLTDRLKHTLISRGIAWYLSYRHDFALYDSLMVLDSEESGSDRQVARVTARVTECNARLKNARGKRILDDLSGELYLDYESGQEHVPDQQGDMCLDRVGFHMARTIAAAHGDSGLRAAIEQGPDHFVSLYNALAAPAIWVEAEEE